MGSVCWQRSPALRVDWPAIFSSGDLRIDRQKGLSPRSFLEEVFASRLIRHGDTLVNGASDATLSESRQDSKVNPKADTRESPTPAPTHSPRIAVFTHDTFGLGHVQRSLHVIRALAERAPQASLLLITGSPAFHLFEALPANADCIKIPTIAKTGSKGFQPPHLPIAMAEVSLLRQRLIRETILAFAPDVLLVDNFPLGSHGELLPTLQEAGRLSIRTILGLRDILDAPDVVRAEWGRQGIYDVLDRYYDRILVYGMREVLDIEEAYALPPRVASKTHYCGYVTATAPPPRSRAEVSAALGITGPFLVATGGGGGDGFPLLKILLEALPLIPSMSAVVFTGPLMSPAHRDKLRAQAAERPSVVIVDYDQDLRSFLAAADMVVAMCGYNIAAEITALRARAVVVPRTWRYGEHLNRATAGEEWEQMLRAQALAKLGFVDLLEPEGLTPERLAERINALRARPKVEPKASMNMQGLEMVTQHILQMAGEKQGISYGN